ncbi:MAG: rhodanese-like domain-containing protein [Polyangiaceae bacterium]|jgi:rhodanese-related sulfurtransferase|nr:rhodanese-like domain-containing protein [Polyangiaceae bacterium]
MATNVRRVSPEEAFALCEAGALYVDVRSEGEFLEGHPLGAFNVPLLHTSAGGVRVPNPDFLEVMGAHFPRDARLVLGCRSGQRSLRAAEQLVAAGYTEIVEQRAGFDGVRDAFGSVIERGWKGSGLPVSFEPMEGRGYTALLGKVG